MALQEPKTKQRRRSSVHKVINSFGKGISKGITAGVTKTKKFAIEKVVKVEATPETNQMIESLNKLNSIKKTISSLSDGTITNLYTEQVRQSIYSLQLSETLMSLKTCQATNDLFKTFSDNVMGRKLFKLNTMTNEYLVKMEKELINPLFIYQSKELKKAETLIKHYEGIKRDYDFALHKYRKLISKTEKNLNSKSTSKSKINSKSRKEKDKLIKFKALQTHRNKITDCINNVQLKQQRDLLHCFEKFWKAYLIFARRQAQILSLKDDFEEKYEAQKQIDVDVDVDVFAPSRYGSEWRNSRKPALVQSNSLRVAVLMNSNSNSNANDEDNEILAKELRYKNAIKLGSGAFATVYKANDLLSEDKEVAIKKICIGDGANVLYLSSTKEEAENELEIMQSLNGHINIIKLLDSYYEQTVYNDLYLNLVMDYVPATLLSQCAFYAEAGDTIRHNVIQIYAFQLIKAVNYMHIKQIIHRDVKPDNLLINTKNHMLKLCDFGCSISMKVEKEKELESYVCSRYYRAPELILQSAYYDCSVDIWSIGCVIAEMFLGTLLFEGDDDENEQLDDIIKKLGTPNKNDIDAMNADYIYKQELLDRDESGESWDMLFCAVIDMPQDAIQLISQMLIYNPSNRLTALQCLKCEYFNRNSFEFKNDKMCEELGLFDWNDLEIQYGKASDIIL